MHGRRSKYRVDIKINYTDQTDYTEGSRKPIRCRRSNLGKIQSYFMWLEKKHSELAALATQFQGCILCG